MAEYNFFENKYPDDKNYDFTIAGAGTAGIFLALKLAAQGKKILKLKAGNME